MAAYLKTVAALVAILGALSGARFVARIVGDEAFARARLARERNAGSVLFESEFRVAQATHVFLLYSAAGSFLTAVIGGSLLWGLGALHEKVDRGSTGEQRG
jgi:hypothetical protein